jgi:hypothetical protein
MQRLLQSISIHLPLGEIEHVSLAKPQDACERLRQSAIGGERDRGDPVHAG